MYAGFRCCYRTKATWGARNWIPFTIEPAWIIDSQVKQLRNKQVPLIKVQWLDDPKGCTWEIEEQIKKVHFKLFTIRSVCNYLLILFYQVMDVWIQLLKMLAGFYSGPSTFINNFSLISLIIHKLNNLFDSNEFNYLILYMYMCMCVYKTMLSNKLWNHNLFKERIL